MQLWCAAAWIEAVTLVDVLDRNSVVRVVCCVVHPPAWARQKDGNNCRNVVKVFANRKGEMDAGGKMAPSAETERVVLTDIRSCPLLAAETIFAAARMSTPVRQRRM